MHTSLCRVVGIILGVALFAPASCRKEQPPAEPSASEEWDRREAEIAKALAEIALKHGAVKDWDQQIEPDGEPGLSMCAGALGGLFTIEVERVLVRPEPVAFSACLSDVRRHRGDRCLVFAHADCIDLSILFVLRASEEMTEEVLKRRPDSFDPFVVVAKIDRVERPFLSLHGEPEGEEQVALKLEANDLPFVALGTCVEFRLMAARADSTDEVGAGR